MSVPLSNFYLTPVVLETKMALVVFAYRWMLHMHIVNSLRSNGLFIPHSSIANAWSVF